MPYQLFYSPEAQEDIEGLSLPLQNFIQVNLERLADNPIKLSRRSVFPFPPNAQLFQFHHPDFDGRRHDFSVLFRFGQDEATLEIVAVGHQERPSPP